MASNAIDRGDSARDSLLPSREMPSPSCWNVNPALRLLSTPWEYFVTIDQSALWQKHIAWAKPKGSDLKAYISSQYSSRMVLLSLLLATEMSVFFNSSPTLANLRQRMNIWEEHSTVEKATTTTMSHGILPFWIGFVLLLNICVTISGILATFSTWNVVSAISDSNAHCLLRSSLGQYVTTLSPRLVVTSLYLFLLWFLLFVVELLFGCGRTSSSNCGLHELLTKHLHLVLLWGFFLVAVTSLFFSIVVPLSAFGRMVLHTGAMAEHPVLSETLQLELLPRGLHAGLVIKAHHSQKRRTAVTRQYRRKRLRQTARDDIEEDARQQQHDHCNNAIGQKLPPPQLMSRLFVGGGIEKEHFHEEDPIDRNEDEMTSPIVQTKFVHNMVPKSTGMSVSTSSSGYEDGDSNSSGDDFRDRNLIIDNRNESRNHDNHERDPYRIDSDRSLGSNSSSCNHLTFFHQKPEAENQTSIQDHNGQENDPFQRKKKHKRILPHRHRHRHRRMLTTETIPSLKLPPAAILNLSMSANEFHEVLKSAFDTSSLYTRSPEISTNGVVSVIRTSSGRSTPVESFGDSEFVSTHHNFSGSLDERLRRNDGYREEEGDCNGVHTSHNRGSRKNLVKIAASANSSNKRGEIALPPFIMTPQTTDRVMDTKLSQKQALATRHHRRVSSSRFLLEEWAQENRVRDLYGVASPANLPDEISWMRENQDDSDDDKLSWQPKSQVPEGKISLLMKSSTNNSIISSSESLPSASNSSRRRITRQHWWQSPFSSPFGAFNKLSTIKPSSTLYSRGEGDWNSAILTNSPGDNKQENDSAKYNETLGQPLLPDLSISRDEELGGELSELLGEGLLLPEGDGRQHTIRIWNPRKLKRSDSVTG